MSAPSFGKQNSSVPGRRFQIHLSTALLLTVAAGMLIWANTRKRMTLVQTDMEVVTYQDGMEYFRMQDTACYGWPTNAVRMLPRGSPVEIPKAYRTSEYYEPTPHWNYLNTALNLIAASVLLAIVWSLGERFLAGRGVNEK